MNGEGQERTVLSYQMERQIIMTAVSESVFGIFIKTALKTVKTGLYKIVPGRLRVIDAGCKKGAGTPVKAPSAGFVSARRGVKILPLFLSIIKYQAGSRNRITAARAAVKGG